MSTLAANSSHDFDALSASPSPLGSTSGAVGSVLGAVGVGSTSVGVGSTPADRLHHLVGMSDLAFATATDTEEDDLLGVRRPLTYLSLCVYGLLFAYIYAQLWLVIRYGYKRWCYRTYVLYASIVWCSLRITLFSYYCSLEQRAALDAVSEAEPRQLSRRVGYLSYFLLYSFPLYLQFTCLCLMVAYFYQIYRSSRNNFHPSEIAVWRWPNYVTLLLNVLVLLVNLLSSVVIKWQEEQEGAALLGTAIYLQSPSLPLLTVWVVHARVLLNGLTFLLMAVALAYLTREVARTSEARLLLETENLTQCSAVLVCILLVFLYVCRTLINILALIPAVSFVLDTDQVDLLSDKRTAYFMFVTMLFLWEFVPTVLMVVFFRVKSPHSAAPLHPGGHHDHLSSSSAHFLTESISDGASSDEEAHQAHRAAGGGGYYTNSSRFSFLYAGNLFSSLASRGHTAARGLHRGQSSPGFTSTGVTGAGGHGGNTAAGGALGTSYSPNNQYYGYEVVDPPTSRNSYSTGGNLRYVSSVPYNLYAGDTSEPPATGGNSNTGGGTGGAGGGVHSLSTRFTHRTSLFSYRILNRTNSRHQDI